jgi:hypothetical protein
MTQLKIAGICANGFRAFCFVSLRENWEIEIWLVVYFLLFENGIRGGLFVKSVKIILFTHYKYNLKMKKQKYYGDSELIEWLNKEIKLIPPIMDIDK